MASRDNYPSRKGKPSVETWILTKLIPMSKLNAILANWKTLLLGIASAATALSDGFQYADIAVLTAAAGLIFAKDADKTNASTQAAEAKPTK